MKTLKDTSCCGIRLQTGSFIVGVLYCSLTILDLCVGAARLGDINRYSGFDSEGERHKAGYVTTVVFAIVQGILSIVLIIGVVKKYPNLLLPWIIWNSILFCLGVFGILILECILISGGMVGIAAAFLLGGLVGGGLAAYCMFIVYSYFKQLKNEVNQGLILSVY